MKTFCFHLAGLLFVAALMVGGLAFAANVLSNPGFELDPADQVQSLRGWTRYPATGGNTLGQAGSTAHTGVNYFKDFQSFNGAVNYNGIYQDTISGPGATYSADGWVRIASTDAMAGQNEVWLEVSFRDASGNFLALYRSTIITTNSLATGAFPEDTWVHLQITNQYDPASFTLINTTSVLVAPAGTYFVRYQIMFQGDAAGSGGSAYFDDLALNQTGNSPYGDWSMVWSDEFNGNTIDPNTWTFDVGGGGWGNNELEYYTARTNNAFVANGCLNIVALIESYGGAHYTSARLKTEGLIPWKYGRFEWRAKLPQGLGFWPALWFLGTNYPDVNWPTCGEIDAMENNGNAPQRILGALHCGSDADVNYFYADPADSVTNFHTYVVDWTPTSFLWYVDGHLFSLVTNWYGPAGPYPAPFDQPAYMLMNLAVGGNYLGNPSTTDIDANGNFPAIMQVDYVRLYNQATPLVLSVTPSKAGIILSWPGNVVAHLQTQTSPGNWTDVPGSSNPFTVAPSNNAAWFRLKSP